MSIKHLKDALRQHYECFTGTADLYVYFYEAGIKLLRAGGTFSFITSNKWFRVAYGEKLRGWLAKNTRVLQLIDFGDAPVFTAIAYPCIVITQRTSTPVEDAAGVRALTWEPGPPIETFGDVMLRKSFTLPQRELKPDGWRLESVTKLRLLERLRGSGKSLSEYVENRWYWGIKTGLNEAFVVDRTTRDRLIAEDKSSKEVLKPFLRGRDVKRWRFDFEQQYLIKIESSENVKHPWSGKEKREAERVFEKTYPAIHTHLIGFRSGLHGRSDQGHYFWELRSCAYWSEFARPKIVVPAISGMPNVAVDFDGYFANNKASIFVSDEARFLAAVVNSPVAFWFTQQVFATKQGGFFDFEPRYSSQWPIPNASTPKKAACERIVECLTWLLRLA